jgi:CBS domain containing-hemolysin-like protein
MIAITFGTADAWMVIAAVLLLMLSSLLAVAETSMTQISKTKARSMVEEGRQGAERVVKVVGDPIRYLNSVRLVAITSQISHAVLVGVVAERVLGGGWVALVAALDVVVVFIVAEAAARTWTLQHSERAALLSAPVIALLGDFAPIRLVAGAFIGLANVILPGKGLHQGPFVSEQELLALADAAVEESVLEGEERDLIESIIDFGDTVVREIMVPRTDMVSMQADFEVTDMVEVAILNGLSRFPVYREGIDDVVGVVFAKDLVRAERDGGGTHPVRDLMRDAFFVPETKKVAELLREMQLNKTHMAIVVDEYGGTAGLVTLEDLLEELVGEIHDEFDADELGIVVEDSGEIVVNDATMNVDDLNEACELDLPEGDWDSVGGLVFSQLGRVPVVGDEVRADGVVLIVEKMDGRRVAVVRIRRVVPELAIDEEVRVDG